MARKKNKEKVITGIVILSIVALIFFASTGFEFNFPFAVGDVPSDLDQAVGDCSGGFTTLSASDVNIVGQGDRIRIFGIAKGSECLTINFKESELDSKLKSLGYEATKDVTGNIRLLEYSKTFPIQTTGSFVGNYNNMVVEGTSFKFANIQNCEESIPQSVVVVDAYRPFPGANLRCVVEGQQGIAGDFVGTSYGNFKARFEFDGSSTTISGRPTTESEVQQSTSLRGGDIRIEWVGFLSNLDEVGVPSSYDAKLVNSRWTLIRSGALNEINGRIRQNLLNCVSTTITDSRFDSCRNNFNSQSSLYLQDKTSEYSSVASNLVYDVSTSSNGLHVSLKAPKFPAFIIDLDAESVGIIALEGKPKITSCIPNQDLVSGNNKIVSYTVKNDAPTDNVEFLTNVVCSQGISPYSTSFNIGANTEKLGKVELIPSNPKETTLSSNCVLTVRDLKSGNSDSCSFGASVEYQSGVLCTPGARQCSPNGNDILECNSQGTNYELIQQCDFGCVFDSSIVGTGDYVCADEDLKEKGFFGKFFDEIGNFFKDLFDFTGGIFKILKTIFVFIVAVGVTLFSKDLISNFRALRNQEWVAWVLGITLGVLAGILANRLFWLGIIALVVFGLLKLTPLGQVAGRLRRRR